MPYTYFLRNVVTGEKYYGVRYANGCDPAELWVTYFSSSKLVAQRIQEHGQSSFEFEVRKVFSTAKQARSWEERVLRRLNVIHREDWLNQNICGKFLKEGPHSQKHRERLAEAMRQSWSRGDFAEVVYRHTEEKRRAISRRLKGVPKTTEHIAHMKCHENNRRIVKCPHCSKRGQYVNMKRWHFENCGKRAEQLSCPHCEHRGAPPNVLRYHFDNCTKRKH